MSVQDGGAAPPKALAGLGVWLDDRFRGAKSVRGFLKKIFPDHWTFLLGEIASLRRRWPVWAWRSPSRLDG